MGRGRGLGHGKCPLLHSPSDTLSSLLAALIPTGRCRVRCCRCHRRNKCCRRCLVLYKKRKVSRRIRRLVQNGWKCGASSSSLSSHPRSASSTSQLVRRRHGRSSLLLPSIPYGCDRRQLHWYCRRSLEGDNDDRTGVVVLRRKKMERDDVRQ